MKQIRIGVVGTIVVDRIIPFNGTPVNSFGGLLYTLLPMLAVLPENIHINPLAHVGEDVINEVKKVLSSFPKIQLENLIPDPNPNNRVELVYFSPDERREKCTGWVSPITRDELLNLAKMDFVLLNFISGFELSLETLQEFREKTKTPIYADLHYLLFGKGEGGKRFPRKLERWEDWIKCLNFVQVNETEAGLLMDKNKIDLNGMKEFGKKIHELGTKVAVITLGPKGAFLSYIDDSREIIQELVPQYPGIDSIDPTGCGDVFAAGFVSGYLMGKGIKKSVEFANQIAGLSCTISGTDNLYAFLTSHNDTKTLRFYR